MASTFHPFLNARNRMKIAALNPFSPANYITPEDLQLTKQLNELGLPLSFQTNKKKSGSVKGKKKGKHSNYPHTCHNPADETLYEVSGEEVVSSKFHDKTSDPLSCISMLGQSESSYCDGAMDLDMFQCPSGEGDNSACCTGFANGVSKEINDNINQSTTKDVQDGSFLISNHCVDLKIALASDTRVFAGSHLTGAGINYCGTEYGESMIDSECLKVSPIDGKNIDCETSYDDDAAAAATSHSHDIESELLLGSSEGIGCDRNDVSNNYDELGDWMALWDTFYKRTYFYNIKTHTSTWDAPPGMEHLINAGCTESDDCETLKAAEVCETQNIPKALEETLIKENLDGKQHGEYSSEIAVAVGNLLYDITRDGEVQSPEHSNECLERTSYNHGVSCCSVSKNQDNISSSNERHIQAAPEVNSTPLQNMAVDISELESKSDPLESTQGKKVKRRQRRKKLYNEAEDMCFQEIPELSSATIVKYWWQRYNLFSRYDDGVKMDEEGWFSVTPEAIAQYQAIRCATDVIIDGFTGVGGNAIQFAQKCRHVIGIDIDPMKIEYARHNAAIYEVDDQIDFIMGDFFLLAPKLKADTVFLSPPWGGPDYTKATTYDMKTMLRPHDGYTLFNVAKEIASRIVMFLPKNINFNQLADLSLLSCPPWSLEVEKVYLNGKLKAITAYFSDTAVGRC
ncbi:hypothetical protein Fmac_032426 [Flemingia macrophylla]|uniref:Trimethylguanosine synthase n=1 Tax=Flemingia macrophylla TaxID=520843 RepID=A0ABD1L4W2_9FABA